MSCVRVILDLFPYFLGLFLYLIGWLKHLKEQTNGKEFCCCCLITKNQYLSFHKCVGYIEHQ